MALFDVFDSIQDAREVANWLAHSFSRHGLNREASSVQVL